MRYSVFLSFSCLSFFISCVSQPRSQFFETVHGPIEVTDPLALELIEHPVFQRLKGIEQHGLNTVVFGEKSFTRFEHSIGVYALLVKYGAPREEQIAGLLHDASHTAFSHVGDHFFGHKDGKESWQDLDHENFLIQSGLAGLMSAKGFLLKEADPKQAQYKRLEQDLPGLCADRINYIIHGGFVLDRLSEVQVEKINSALHFDTKLGEWWFDDVQAAEDFSKTSLWMTENCWGGKPEDFAASKWLVRGVKMAVADGSLTERDFRWGTNELVWSKLEGSKNDKVQTILEKIKTPGKFITFQKNRGICKQGSLSHTFKLRFVDPLVKQGSEWLHLSQVRPKFAELYKRKQKELSSGFCVELL